MKEGRSRNEEEGRERKDGDGESGILQFLKEHDEGEVWG